MAAVEQPAWDVRDTVRVATSLALAGGFIAWTAASDGSRPDDPRVALLGFLARALAVLVGAGVLCALARSRGRTRLLTRLAWTSGLACLAALRFAGLAPAPWIALVLVLAAAWGLRAPQRPAGGMLLLGAMTTLAGLHFSFKAEHYLDAAPGFLAALRALSRLLAAG